MESTEHWRTETAHVYINLSRREEVWHDISPGSHTAGGRRSPKADWKIKTHFTLVLLIFVFAFEQQIQKKIESGFDKSSTVNIHFYTEQGLLDMFRILKIYTLHYTKLYYN